MKQCKLFTLFSEWEQVHKEIKKKKQTFMCSITFLDQ